MSKSSLLKEKNLDRLDNFLQNGNLNQCATYSGTKIPALRECIVNTTNALLLAVSNSEDKFFGNSNHTKDIYANRKLIKALIERVKTGVSNSCEKKIGQMTKPEFKVFLNECLSEYFRGS